MCRFCIHSWHITIPGHVMLNNNGDLKRLKILFPGLKCIMSVRIIKMSVRNKEQISCELQLAYSEILTHAVLGLKFMNMLLTTVLFTFFKIHFCKFNACGLMHNIHPIKLCHDACKITTLFYVWPVALSI